MMSSFLSFGSSRLYAPTILLVSLAAYAEQNLPPLLHKPPALTAWVPAATKPTLQKKRRSKAVDGFIDLLELSGEKIEGGMIRSDSTHAGLEVGGWMVLPRYRRPLFATDELTATLVSTSDRHEYHFRGASVERQDIAKIFFLPSSHLGFRFRMDLSAVAPDTYRLKIARRNREIVPDITIIRM